MENTINFMGDLILGDQPVIYGAGLNSKWQHKKFRGIFDGVKPVLQNAKYNVANFESVIKKYENDRLSVSEWSMCCDESICNELQQANINIVSIANNHTMDYGRKWFDYTVDNLRKYVQIIGLKEEPYIKIEINNKKIALVACSYLKVFNSDDIGYFYSPTKEQWEDVVSKCQDCDKIIAYVHWGSEFVSTPTEKQIEQAKEILSSGVDIIIGHHPHILQTKKLIDNKPVIFSLGNFVTDYWQERLRKTEIISMVDDKLYQTPCIINKKTCAVELVSNDKTPVNFNKLDKPCSVSKERMRMRLEYLIKIVTVFPKIKEKRKFFIWVYKRVKYVLKYASKEKSNPDIIYEHYEN